MVEGTYRGLKQGLVRTWPNGESGVEFSAPRRLALEFPRSRARRFPELLARTQAMANRGEAELVALDVSGRRRYRLLIVPTQATATAGEARWVHAACDRLKGVRVWFNGWPVDTDGPWSLRTRQLLLDAWLQAARDC